jgi:hypothetical protein
VNLRSTQSVNLNHRPAHGKLSGASVEILARLWALWAENAILPFRRTSVRVLLRGAWFDNSLFGPSK